MAVEESAPGIPKDFALGQNYPNPFSLRGVPPAVPHATVIDYHLPTSGSVSFEIFDMMGRRVRTLLKQNQPAGSYRVAWDGRSQDGREAPAGVYFYRLQAQQQTATRKLVLLR
jgi:hypothetical protein